MVPEWRSYVHGSSKTLVGQGREIASDGNPGAAADQVDIDRECTA
jgi:hypothetical protein